jgi:hypothetical protein
MRTIGILVRESLKYFFPDRDLPISPINQRQKAMEVGTPETSP